MTVRSPFVSPRAIERAPTIMSFAAVPGAALLVSSSGAIAASAGHAADLEMERLARMSMRVAMAGSDVLSFRDGDACVHVAGVAAGYRLCVVSMLGMAPDIVRERALRAAEVLRLALLDGAPPTPASGGSGPASATVFASVGSRKLRPHGGE